MPRGRPVALVVLALALAAPTAARAQLTQGITQARDAMEAGEEARARGLFTALTRSADLREAATAVYYLAVMDDEAMEFASALARYRDFLARDPGSRFAARAQARVDDLAAHAEGGFAPLVMLETVRRDEALASSLEGIGRLDRALARFPAGPVRAEARMLVGVAYLERLDRPRDAARVLGALARDPAASREMRSLAAEKLVGLRAELGEEAQAEAEVRALAVDADVQRQAAVLARRGALRKTSRAVLAATVAMLALALAWTRREGRLGAVWRAWRRPIPLVQLGLLTLGGGALARVYDEHDVAPFAALGAGALAVYLAAAAWSVAAGPRAWLRAAGAALSLVAVLAVSFLTMDALDVMMLEGISL